MHRRNMLKTFGGAGAGLLASPGPLAQAQDTARRGLPPLKITDIKTILTQPAGDHLVIVKVLTSEPGLYGVGCATHRERPLAVAAYVDNYLKPFLVGRNCDEIEDIWQSTYVQSYFRSGVTGNNALSGVDGALWDILGKRCGVPRLQASRRQSAGSGPTLHARIRPGVFATRGSDSEVQGRGLSIYSRPVSGSWLLWIRCRRADRRRNPEGPADRRLGFAGVRAHSVCEQHDQDVRSAADPRSVSMSSFSTIFTNASHQIRPSNSARR